MELIMRCIMLIKRLYEKYHCPILVTSDSGTFLKMVGERCPHAYVISGTVIHMDFVGKNEEVDIGTYLKSFVDFFMLANARILFRANIKPLYGSGFPLLASKVYGHDCYSVNEHLEFV